MGGLLVPALTRTDESFSQTLSLPLSLLFLIVTFQQFVLYPLVSFSVNRRRADRRSAWSEKAAWPRGFVLRHLAHRSRLARQVGHTELNIPADTSVRRPRIFRNSISPNARNKTPRRLIGVFLAIVASRFLFDYNIMYMTHCTAFKFLPIFCPLNFQFRLVNTIRLKDISIKVWANFFFLHITIVSNLSCLNTKGDTTFIRLLLFCYYKKQLPSVPRFPSFCDLCIYVCVSVYLDRSELRVATEGQWIT